MSITDADSVYGPGGAENFNVTGIGGNPYPYGECTYYVWQFYHDTQQIDIPPNLGNATDWDTSAHREQWAVDMTPAPAKAVNWSDARYPPFGHVAVVERTNGDGSFDVLEMNFTYYASDRPQLAGKIDRRTVRDLDAVKGFITPNGVRIATGQTGNSLLDALNVPLTSIGDAIRMAALQLQAQAMTAELKAVSVGQLALGTLVSGGGVALAGFTLAGGGSPRRGLGRARARLRPVQRRLTPEPMRPPSPIGQRSLRPAEERWVPRRTREQLVGERATAKLQRGVDPRSLTDAEAAWLQQHPEAATAALRARAG